MKSIKKKSKDFFSIGSLKRDEGFASFYLHEHFIVMKCMFQHLSLIN